MKNILITILVIVILVAGYFYFKPRLANNNSLTSNTSEEAGMKTYRNAKFSFSYPEEYAVAETEGGIRLTSVPVPSVDEAKCSQLADEQARASCRKPENSLSPNMTIKFLPGNGQALWENELFGSDYPQEYKAMVLGEVKEVRLGDPAVTHKYYSQGGEYGGYGKYALILNDGLLLSTYVHMDNEGGYQFSQMKSDKYRLDNRQQKILLEQILSTLKVNLYLR